MSETTPEKGPETPVEATEKPEAPETPEKPSDAGTEPETFPRAYVEELRRENAEARTKSKRADELAARLVTALAASTGRLADPSDLPVTDDLMDDGGFPDAEKVTAAVADLLERKPHLAATRPVGDVGQGVRGDIEAMPSLAQLLRQGAG
jgi:hypothetical protein